GQRCTSTRRIIAHKSVVEELGQRLVKAYGQVNIGNPLDEGRLMGPLVTDVAVEKMESALQRAQQEGGQVLTGGKRIEGNGNYVEPTIVRKPEQSGVVKEETFAPVLYILDYENVDDALRIHNDVPQGLSSAFF